MLFNSNILTKAIEEEKRDLIRSVEITDAPLGSYIYQTNMPTNFKELFVSYLNREYEEYYNDEGDLVESEDDYRLVYSGAKIHKLYNDCVRPSDALKIKGSIKIIKQLAKMIADEDDLLFFGMLLSDGTNYINPLNPIVATELLSTGIPFNEYTIIIYPLRYAVKVNDFSEELDRWADIVKFIAANSTLIPHDISLSDEEKLRLLNLDYYKLLDTEILMENQPSFGIVPIQTMMYEGIAYPFYGAIETEFISNEYKSRNLTKFITGNISNSHIDNEENIYTGDFDSTCIGDYSQSNFQNMYHMNIVNSSSTYHELCAPEEWASTVKASIVMSYNLLKGLDDEENSD